MMGQHAKLLLVLNFLARSAWCNAELIQGEKVVPANSAIFLGKFCFDFDKTANNSGQVQLVLESALPAQGTMKVIMLDDEANSYPDSNDRWPGYGCDDSQLMSVAKGSKLVDLSFQPKNNIFTSLVKETIRPRFWFLAVLDCTGISREIKYTLHMRNPRQGWFAEISMDHCGLGVMLVFLAVYLATALLQVHTMFLQTTARKMHPLRLLLTFGICAALWGMGFYSFDTVWYAMHGERTFLLYLAAKMFKAGSKFTLLLMCILLSKGRCISHDLQTRDIVHGASTTIPFLVVSFCLEIWGEYDQSRKYTTSFIYLTWVGGLLVVADLFLLGLYGQNLLRTYHEESDPDKKQFYRRWGSVYSSAFLALPVGAIASGIVSPWVRVEVMFVFFNSVHSVLLALMIAALWPDKTQPVFCIDKGADLATTFGNHSGNLLEEEMKVARGGEYQQFVVEDCMRAECSS